MTRPVESWQLLIYSLAIHMHRVELPETRLGDDWVLLVSFFAHWMLCVEPE